MQERRYGASILGIDEEELRTELYVLASSVEEADTKIKTYATNVTEILRPYHLRCEFKIRPKIKRKLN